MEQFDHAWMNFIIKHCSNIQETDIDLEFWEDNSSLQDTPETIEILDDKSSVTEDPFTPETITIADDPSSPVTVQIADYPETIWISDNEEEEETKILRIVLRKIKPTPLQLTRLKNRQKMFRH